MCVRARMCTCLRVNEQDRILVVFYNMPFVRGKTAVHVCILACNDINCTRLRKSNRIGNRLCVQILSFNFIVSSISPTKSRTVRTPMTS